MRALLIFGLVGLSCAPPATPECTGPADCDAPAAAPCDSCPPLATTLCVNGACQPRGQDAVDVSVTVRIDRALDGVRGLVYAVLADTPCADAVALDATASALSSGQFSLSGGDVHPDLSFGRVPVGAVTVVAVATAQSAGQGARLGVGCVRATATGPALRVAELVIAQ